MLNERAGFMGGVEQNMHDAARTLAERGHETHLAYGIECRDFDAMTAPFASSRQTDALRPDRPAGGDAEMTRIVDEVDPDVVYLHKVPTVEPLRPFFGRRRVVRMVHDHDLCCPRHHKYFTFNKRICEQAVGWRCWVDLGFLRRDRKSRLGIGLVDPGAWKKEIGRHRELDAILVGSRFMRRELIINGIPAERVHTVAPVLSAPGTAPPAPIPEDPEILYVGQLVTGKGVDLLLGALAMVERPFRLRVAGTGNAAEFLEAETRRLASTTGSSFCTGCRPPRCPACSAAHESSSSPLAGPNRSGWWGSRRCGRAGRWSPSPPAVSQTGCETVKTDISCRRAISTNSPVRSIL